MSTCPVPTMPVCPTSSCPLHAHVPHTSLSPRSPVAHLHRCPRAPRAPVCPPQRPCAPHIPASKIPACPTRPRPHKTPSPRRPRAPYVPIPAPSIPAMPTGAPCPTRPRPRRPIPVPSPSPGGGGVGHGATHRCAGRASPCGGRCSGGRAPARRSPACPLCPRAPSQPASVGMAASEAGGPGGGGGEGAPPGLTLRQAGVVWRCRGASGMGRMRVTAWRGDRGEGQRAPHSGRGEGVGACPAPRAPNSQRPQCPPCLEPSRSAL